MSNDFLLEGHTAIHIWQREFLARLRGCSLRVLPRAQLLADPIDC